MSLKEELLEENNKRKRQNDSLADERYSFFEKLGIENSSQMSWEQVVETLSEEQLEEYQTLLTQGKDSRLKNSIIIEYMLEHSKEKPVYPMESVLEESLLIEQKNPNRIASPFADVVSQEINKENPNKGDAMVFLGERIELEEISHLEPAEQIQSIKNEFSNIIMKKGYTEEELQTACTEVLREMGIKLENSQAITM